MSDEELAEIETWESAQRTSNEWLHSQWKQQSGNEESLEKVTLLRREVLRLRKLLAAKEGSA